MQRKTVVLAGAVILVAAVVLYAVTRPGTTVRTITVEPGRVTRTAQDTGYVQPVHEYDLYAAAGSLGTEATVVRVPVSRGQKVRQGQVLVRLVDHNLDQQVAGAAAALAPAEAGVASAKTTLENTRLAWRQAQRDFARTQALYRAGAATRAQFEQVQTDLATARENWQDQNTLLQQATAQADSLRQSLRDLKAEEGQLTVTSPVAGVVLSLPAKPQAAVAPGTLMAVVGCGGLEVKVDILSDDMAGVRVGDPATVTAPVLGGAVLSGRVVEVYPRAVVEESALGEQQRRVPVIVSLPAAEGLEPGYKVQVAVVTATADHVLVVPREAVRTAPDGREEVLKVAGGRVRYTSVTCGLAGTDNVVVTSGLKAGAVIVRDATQNLPDNSRVRAVR